MLGLLGDEWTLLIIQQALLGATRYGEFATAPTGVALGAVRPAAIADRERIARPAASTRPIQPRSEYLATARSRSLWPMLMSIWEWERAWVADHAEQLPGMRHDRLWQRFRTAGHVQGVWCRDERERRCGAMGSERILAAVDSGRPRIADGPATRRTGAGCCSRRR